MKTSLAAHGISHLRFIPTTAAAFAAPTFIPANALGKDGRPAPSERSVMGIIGWGDTNGQVCVAYAYAK